MPVKGFPHQVNWGGMMTYFKIVSDTIPWTWTLEYIGRWGVGAEKGGKNELVIDEC